MSKKQVFKKAKDLAAPILEFVLCATPRNPCHGGCFPVLQFQDEPDCEQEECADLHEPAMALPVGIPSEHWGLRKDWEPPSGRIQPSKSKIQMQSSLLPVQEKAKE